MATQTKRWAVREDESKGGYYWIFRGPKPSIPEDGNWYDLADSCPDSVECITAGLFEWICPEQVHLPPGGGPVEIRFADEE